MCFETFNVTKTLFSVVITTVLEQYYTEIYLTEYFAGLALHPLRSEKYTDNFKIRAHSQDVSNTSLFMAFKLSIKIS